MREERQLKLCPNVFNKGMCLAFIKDDKDKSIQSKQPDFKLTRRHAGYKLGVHDASPLQLPQCAVETPYFSSLFVPYPKTKMNKNGFYAPLEQKNCCGNGLSGL